MFMFCEMKSDSYHDFLACLSTAIRCQNIVEDPIMWKEKSETQFELNLKEDKKVH